MFTALQKITTRPDHINMTMCDYDRVLKTFKHHGAKVVLNKYTIIETGRTREVCNWLQCLTPADQRAALAEQGFKAENFFGDVAGSLFSEGAPEFAARKSLTP